MKNITDRRADMKGVCLALLTTLCLPAAGQALQLSLPGNAEKTHEVVKTAESYLLPIGPYSDGAIEALEIEGQVTQQAWRIEAQGLTTLQMLSPLREQLLSDGFEPLYDCAGQECGGFDFRFNTDVLPAPDMFVDLFDYRFLSARKAVSGGPEEYVSVIVSNSGATGYVQIIDVSTGPAKVSVTADMAKTPGLPVDAGSLAQGLVQRGHVVLNDLEFEPGSSSLGKGPFATLEALAAFLKTDPNRRVALVGHTDAVGSLSANFSLSKRRASSALERLVAAYGIARGQLEAGGMGYLSPVASNLTAEGREANRRVEAVLLNHE